MIRMLAAGHAAGAEPRCGAASSNLGPILGQFQQRQGMGWISHGGVGRSQGSRAGK